MRQVATKHMDTAASRTNANAATAGRDAIVISVLAIPAVFMVPVPSHGSASVMRVGVAYFAIKVGQLR